MPAGKRQLWLLLLVETAFLAALAGWVLWRLDRLFEPLGLLVALAIIVAGDVVSVMLMQHFAPTVIALEPGEHAPALGRVVSGFADDVDGIVLVRGERWQARCEHARLQPGDHVLVRARSGLTLLVEPVEQS